MKLKIFKFILMVFILCWIISAQALSKGNSAWLYGKEKNWIKQIQEYNRSVSPNQRLNYLFPETGIIHIDSLHDALLMTYDATVTKFYKQQLKNVTILADLSFWVAHTNFKNWPVEKYYAAADQIAAKINQDIYADGVFLDLESYKPTLLPFYQKLVNDLQTHHKILSVIVRPGEENKIWFQTLGNNAFVVLYGYDLHQPEDTPFPVSPKKYQQRLKIAVDHFIKVAESANMSIMAGIPAAATTYEWEQKIIENKKLTNPYHQIDYFTAALKIYHQISSPFYLGVSIWAFLSDTKPQSYYPYRISQKEWEILSKT